VSAHRVEIVGEEVLDELRPLWLALKRHHGAMAPGEGPVRDDDDAWRHRRRLYGEWITEPGAFVALARDAGGRPVGYAFVTLNGPGATWPRPERFGYVESLVLLPEARGGGLGRELLRAVWDRVAELGGTEVRLGVIAANAPARQFYEALGFEPLELTVRTQRRP
jgi:ribosomal protein S18 acetylase RimI-like enzyme